MQRSAKIALVACVAVVVLGSFGFWWFVLRSTAPPEAALRVGPDGTTVGSVPDSVEGTWTVISGEEDVFVGYRIMELFAADTVKKEAVGRTNALEGSLTIEGSTVTAAIITADVTKLRSDQMPRDNIIRREGLESDTYPEATFVLTEPIELPTAPEIGTTYDVTATGELTLHGVTRPVTIQLKATWAGATIEVAGKTRLVLADFGIEPISIPMVTVDDEGDLEVQLGFRKA